MHAFDHFQSKLLCEEVKSATGIRKLNKEHNKIGEWCQDQWRRKDPVLPQSPAAYFENKPSTLPWFNNIRVCHRCGVPGPTVETNSLLHSPCYFKLWCYPQEQQKFKVRWGWRRWRWYCQWWQRIQEAWSPCYRSIDVNAVEIKEKKTYRSQPRLFKQYYR